MNLMKLKYKNEILLFFIVVFGFIILYYGLGKIYNKGSIIEGNVTSETKNIKSKNESIEVKQMKKKLKIMENDITNKVEPKVNKLLEKIKVVRSEVSAGIKKETDGRLNSFAESNKETKSVSKQDNVTPFSSSEIKNVI
jgi:hypothetical protein